VGRSRRALFLLYLAWQAGRDAVALWRRDRQLEVSDRWAFWKGVAGNLANPLTWTFWLATGTPAMLAAQRAGGRPGWCYSPQSGSWSPRASSR
jgi:threonine/homoserine/homoserine lactone efflux protein